MAFPPILFLLLVSTVSAQTVYYCQSSTRTIIDVTTTTFRIKTVPSDGSIYYKPNMNCQFKILTTTAIGRYMITVEEVDFSTKGSTVFSALTSEIGSRELIPQITQDTTLDNLKMVRQFASEGNSFIINFKTDAYTSSSNRGITLTVSFFNSFSCPFNWYKGPDSYCYGKLDASDSASDVFTYTESNTVCNRMRANLMTTLTSDASKIRDFLRSSGLLTADAWIGLNDLASQESLYWLSGYKYAGSKSYIRCDSNILLSYDKCMSSERCAYFEYSSSTFFSTSKIVLTDCKKNKKFICSMPTGGTDRFYTVPDRDSSVFDTVWFSLAKQIGTGIGVLVVISIIVGVSVVSCRKQQARRMGRPPFFQSRSPTTTNVVVGQPTVYVGQPTSVYSSGQTAPYPQQVMGQSAPYPQQAMGQPAPYPQQAMGQPAPYPQQQGSYESGAASASYPDQGNPGAASGYALPPNDDSAPPSYAEVIGGGGAYPNPAYTPDVKN